MPKYTKVMNSKIIIFAAFIVLSAFSCRATKEGKNGETKEGVNKIKLDSKNPIVGNWSWLETYCCGRMKGVEKASITKEIKGLNIYPDGNYERTENGKVTTTGKYTMGTGTPYKGRESIQFDENVGALLQINGDTAILSWEYMDLQIETYVRAK
ncbi:MAG: hypothetical protein IPI52_01550 [Bacteroidetes bacterium]|nr:hypothetical protein [Bacteroidota bacterium]